MRWSPARRRRKSRSRASRSGWWDRIDRLADGRQVIIDYKTGASIDTKNWAAQRITEPQLPIYAALVNDEVAAVVFASAARQTGLCRRGDEKDILPGVQGIGDDKQKIFDPADFRTGRGRYPLAGAPACRGWRGEGRVAGVSFADERAAVLRGVALLRLPERRCFLAAAAEQFVETGSDSGT